MFHVVLFEPEIPPNTGNIIRLCANTGCQLHLIEPLGFELDDKRLRRAGLDYHEYATMRVHENWDDCCRELAGHRFFAATTKAATRYDTIAYQPGDVFVFGPESRGLPDHLIETFAPAQRLRLPMLPERRSVNLSNAVAVMVYEAWRQHGFAGGQ